MAIFQSGARMLLAGLLRRLDGVAGVDCLPGRRHDPGDVAELAADYDIVVCHRDETAPAPATQRWEVVPLLREPLDVFLPPGHPLPRRRRLRLAELAGEAWISVEVGWPVDDVLRSIAVRTGTAPRVVQRINDFSVTEELVAAGRGHRAAAALLDRRPRRAAAGAPAAGRGSGGAAGGGRAAHQRGGPAGGTGGAGGAARRGGRRWWPDPASSAATGWRFLDGDWPRPPLM